MRSYMEPKRYPRQLSRGANNAVIALSETEVGKLFNEDTRSDIGSEAEKMRFANSVNGLVVKFLRLEANVALAADMLVMERVYPLDFRAYEVEMREIWFDIFTDELQALHSAGFVHRDLLRPSNLPGDRYDNILLTAQGLRLIDVGISVLRPQVGESFFNAYLQREREELALFRQFFLTR
jgi:serine/threonine protein kinase